MKNKHLLAALFMLIFSVFAATGASALMTDEEITETGLVAVENPVFKWYSASEYQRGPNEKSLYTHTGVIEGIDTEDFILEYEYTPSALVANANYGVRLMFGVDDGYSIKLYNNVVGYPYDGPSLMSSTKTYAGFYTYQHFVTSGSVSSYAMYNGWYEDQQSATSNNGKTFGYKSSQTGAKLISVGKVYHFFTAYIDGVLLQGVKEGTDDGEGNITWGEYNTFTVTNPNTGKHGEIILFLRECHGTVDNISLYIERKLSATADKEEYSVDDSITLTFSEAIDNLPESVTMTANEDEEVICSVEAGASADTVIIIPEENLEANTEYTIDLSCFTAAYDGLPCRSTLTIATDKGLLPVRKDFTGYNNILSVSSKTLASYDGNAFYDLNMESDYVATMSFKFSSIPTDSNTHMGLYFYMGGNIIRLLPHSKKNIISVKTYDEAPYNVTSIKEGSFKYAISGLNWTTEDTHYPYAFNNTDTSVQYNVYIEKLNDTLYFGIKESTSSKYTWFTVNASAVEATDMLIRNRLTTVLTVTNINVYAKSASIVLPNIIADGMLIQQNKPIRIWGTSVPETDITVTISDNEGTAVRTANVSTDSNGSFTAELDSLTAGGPYTIKIANGTAFKTIDNVLIGELWHYGGQSNMQLTVSGCDDKASDMYPEADISDIRYYKDGSWMSATVSRVANMSAVAWISMKHMYDSLGVPVGGICTAIGGTNMAHWTGKYADYATAGAGFTEYVEPTAKMPIAGVMWYQGENDCMNGNFEGSFKNLISSWRTAYGEDDLPFIFAELPQSTANVYGTWKYGYVYAREAQLSVYKEMKNDNVGMVVIYDTVHEEDMDTTVTDESLHPRNKMPVGTRMANYALATVYGKELEHLSPTEAEVTDNGDYAVITFNNVYDGLKTTDGEAPAYFEIIDGDGVYHKAAAEILDSDSVKVYCEGVTDIDGVAYARENAYRDLSLTVFSELKVNLVNSAGLPVSPMTVYVNDGVRDWVEVLYDDCSDKSGWANPKAGSSYNTWYCKDGYIRSNSIYTNDRMARTDFYTDFVMTFDLMLAGIPDESASPKQIRLLIIDQNGKTIAAPVNETLISWNLSTGGVSHKKALIVKDESAENYSECNKVINIKVVVDGAQFVIYKKWSTDSEWIKIFKHINTDIAGVEKTVSLTQDNAYAAIDNVRIYKKSEDIAVTPNIGMNKTVTSRFDVDAETNTVTGGIRFKAYISDADRTAYAEEYGFIVARSSHITSAGDELTHQLLHPESEEPLYVEGVCYNKSTGKNVYFDRDETNWYFTGVCVGIPTETAATIKEDIIARPYMVMNVDGEAVYVYGDTVSYSLGKAMLDVKTAGGTDYTDNQEYVDKIVDLYNS